MYSDEKTQSCSPMENQPTFLLLLKCLSLILYCLTSLEFAEIKTAWVWVACPAVSGGFVRICYPRDYAHFLLA